ncbi:MAG: hypothetical protein RO257_10255 [Candidatus Kapabacteria bacterium]|jgi:hypothetical protein|nr:hypothetical protein [Candidatus Kapabacteria bacterium]
MSEVPIIKKYKLLKMKVTEFKLSSILLVFFIFLILGCTDMILEYESVADLQIIVMKENGKNYIEISGLCMHSSMNIDKVQHKEDGNSLYVQVYLTLRRRVGSSGNLKEKIEISENVKNVYFGKNKKLIWDNRD